MSADWSGLQQGAQETYEQEPSLGLHGSIEVGVYRVSEKQGGMRFKVQAENKSQTALFKLFAFDVKNLKKHLKNFKQKNRITGAVGQRMGYQGWDGKCQHCWQEDQVDVTQPSV